MPSTATGTSPPTAIRTSARIRPPVASRSAPTATAVKVLKNAVCRHSVARLVRTPAVNQRRCVTAHSAPITKSVIGVFSRGPLDAYWMKPWTASIALAVTRPAPRERNRSRPSR